MEKSTSTLAGAMILDNRSAGFAQKLSVLQKTNVKLL